ncbi:MAG: hypothetical protein AAGB29_08645 [Planctomycetota bacterium]
MIALLGWLVILVGLAGIVFPVSVSAQTPRWHATLPLLSLLLFLLYELTNDPLASIRIDWACMFPLLFLSLVAMLYRIGRIRILREQVDCSGKP